MKRNKVLSFLLATTLPQMAPAQSLSTRFQTPDHLSNPHVNTIVEDTDGYIWAGTSRGLNRYNGTSYTYYYTGPGQLINDNITALAPDSGERLWIGHESGIQLMKDGQIDPVFQCKVGYIRQIAVLDEGHLLFSIAGGVYVLDKTTAAVHPVYQNPRMVFNTFMLTSDGHLWLYDFGSLIMTVLDSQWRIVREFPLSDLGPAPAEGTDGTVYFPTEHGLIRYAGDGTPIDLPQALESVTRGKRILFYVSKGASSFLGIEGEGIFDISPEGDPVPRWTSERLNEGISCPPLLTETNLWLSKTEETLTNLYRLTDDNILDLPPQFAPHMLNKIRHIGGMEILVLTNAEIYRQDVENGQISVIEGNGLQGDHKIGHSLQDRKGNWWIQLNNYDLCKYKLEGSRMHLLGRFSIEATNCLWDDASGNVYVLQGNGILRISPEGRSELLAGGNHPDFWHCGQLRTGRVFFLADDDIWFLGEGGRFYPMESGVPNPSCFHEDLQGQWWIGSKTDGVWRYDTQTRTAMPIDFGDSDADRCIRALSSDNNGNIWASLRFDYLKIDRQGNLAFLKSPDSGRSVNYTNCIVILEDGTPVFGSNIRIIRFLQSRRESIEGQTSIPLSLDNVAVNGHPISQEELLLLNHKTESLSFQFSGMNYDPERIPVYQYKLEGYDKDWLFAGTMLQTHYSSLHPGHYTFRVRVQLQDGTWDKEELVIPVRIKPSPWLSWPAILTYLLLLLFLLVFFIRQVIHIRLNREKLEISEQEKRLIEQISQERTTFFTNVSHEFRTPLSLIYGPVKELWKSPTLTEGERHLVSIIERNSERMLRLTDQFLHFNQSRTNRDTLTVMRTDLSVLLRRMLRNFEYMFRQKSLQISMGLPSELVVYCDREKVERIVFNLLSNAVKYTPEHGGIQVSAALTEGLATVEVADTGIGISPDKTERIFERYERLGERVGNDIPSGFGIGLNYAKHLAVIHKGDIRVRPNDPIGSVFTFTFPADKTQYSQDTVWQEENAETSEIIPAVPEVTDGKKASLLIVEDNADMRDYIRDFLSDDFQITLAGDGEEAWHLIRISAPDLIVSDVMMPFKDGYTLCKEIKNDPEYCHIPVILLTAKADMDNQLHGLELGADGYLGKPFDPAYLHALIHNLLANRRRLQGILAEQTVTTAQVDTGMSPQDKAFLERCWKIIEEHLSEEDFNVTMLAMEVGMSRTSVYTKLTALTGQSPQAYLTNYRLNRAMDLLKEHTWNIGEVAYKVGFSTHTGFSRAFKNKFGVPPSSV